MTNLIYSHLCLFTYHLKAAESSQEDADSPKYHPFLNGFSSRCTLADTDSLLIACSVEDKHHSPDVLPLPSLKQKLLTKREEFAISGELLGKTWLIAGYLQPFSSHEEVAKSAYKSLNFGKWHSHEPGEFMGAKFFEIWQTPQNWENLEAENNQVLIIIYPDLNAMRNMANFYEDWRKLCCYRHKVVWAYGNTRQIKPMLAVNFSPSLETLGKIQRISPEANLLESELDQLKLSLDENYKTLRFYAEGISLLEVQMQTIKTNCYNYLERLKTIETKAKNIEPNQANNLDILKKFSDIVQYKYQPQVEQDNAALTPGLRLREKEIDTIRGIVEIRQAQLHDIIEKRDRIFQETVETWGVGLATAGITATAFSPFIAEITKPIFIKKTDQPTPYWLPWLNLTATIIITIFTGLFAKWLAGKWVKSRRPPKP